MIFVQAMGKILGKETSAPRNETRTVHLLLQHCQIDFQISWSNSDWDFQQGNRSPGTKEDQKEYLCTISYWNCDDVE